MHHSRRAVARAVKGSATIERCAASACAAGVFEVTVAGRFAPRKYQAPTATITISNAAAAASGARVERFFTSVGFASFGATLAQAISRGCATVNALRKRASASDACGAAR
jgi:hypothetical protein